MYTWNMGYENNTRAIWCACNAKTYVSVEVRVVLMKFAWMVSYRDTLPGVYLLHTMANDAKVLRNTVFEVIHPAYSLPKRNAERAHHHQYLLPCS